MDFVYCILMKEGWDRDDHSCEEDGNKILFLLQHWDLALVKPGSMCQLKCWSKKCLLRPKSC